jgi:hypothetical protein
VLEILTTTTTTIHIEQDRTSISTQNQTSVRVRVCVSDYGYSITRQALDNCNNMAVISRRAIRFRGSEGTCHVLTIKRMFIIHNTNYLVHTFFTTNQYDAHLCIMTIEYNIYSIERNQQESYIHINLRQDAIRILDKILAWIDGPILLDGH